MTKDESLLSGVSALFTEKTLEESLRNATGENEVQVLGWDFGDASKKGDGYLSVISRIKVNGTAGGKPIQISLVVKSMPNNLARRKTFRSNEFFYNEVTCYTEIFPKFQEFVKSKNAGDLLMVPRCFAALTDGENDYLVLEDVISIGFQPLARQNSLQVQECRLILKALARLHAVSFAYKDQKKEEFQRIANRLIETYFTPKLYDWYKGFQTLIINMAKDALAKEYPGSEAEKRFNSWTGRELYDKSIDFCNRVTAPTSVITQGDAWAPNFMIRKTDREYPDALALDFQLARCASPALDVSFFIYTCTEKPLRDGHYDEFLKLYHHELGRSISMLKSDPEKLYPWDTFMNEVQEQSIHGINFALETAPGVSLDESEAFDMDSIEGDEPVDVSVIWNLKNLKTKKSRCRLAETIMHAVEKNYI